MRAVCFDLDGTLGGFRGDLGGLVALARSELGLERCDMNSFSQVVLRELRADGPLDLVEVLRRTLDALEQREPPGVTDVASAVTARYAADFRPAPGAAQLLDRLHSRGVRLGLVTNGPADMQRAALASLGFERYFSVVVVSGDPDVGARKPAARPFALACSGLGTAPAETLMVGDDPVADVQGALGAGIPAVLIGGDRDGRELGVPAVGGIEPLDVLLRSRYGL